ncbi:MAG: hypothetical protein IPM54_35130 [Polyangiaceae bacterium]|nr:hypothetical protein [Polyangiaceae bacterium]
MVALIRRGLAVRGMLLLGVVGVGMTGACMGEIGPVASAIAPDASSLDASTECVVTPDKPEDMPTQCPAPVEDPCERYRLELLGDPTNNPTVRAKYIAAFGDACYQADNANRTFDCWYKTWKEACEDAALIGEVSGNAPFDKGYECKPDGKGNYWLQTGSDPSIRTWIYFDDAPRQTPLVEVDGVLVEVNGPYRNLPEPPTVGIAQPFNKCFSGMLDANGGAIYQREYILQVNRNAHKNAAGVGEIHSDLAGFKWTCERLDENCKVVMEECEEPLVLYDPFSKEKPFDPALIARVHHVVPMKDKRLCGWGTNSNKNAAVISTKLNNWLSNKNPPAEEVKQLNKAPAYTP